MARMRDMAVVWREMGPWSFIKQVWTQVDEDNIFVWAAALAYSWLFAIFPFLIFLLTLTPYLPIDHVEAMEHIQEVLDQALPGPTAKWLGANIHSVLSQPRNGLMSIGALLTLWVASGGMAMTMSALDRCYDIDINRPFYKQRPIAIGLTVIVAVLATAVLLLLPIGTAAMQFAENWLVRQQNVAIGAPVRWTFDIVRWTISVMLMLLMLSVVYRFGPRVKQYYRFFSPGAVFCVVVWVVLGLFFRVYINVGKYDQTYGAVGGVAVLLLVFYVDALVLLVGAEINSEVDFAVLKVPNGTLNFRVKPSESAANPEMPSP